MELAICHYSLHRTFTARQWTLADLVGYVEGAGVTGIDFHVRFLGDVESAADRILAALSESNLVLAGLSLSTNFNQDDPVEFRKQIETARDWLEVAGAIGGAVSAPCFGGHLNRSGRTHSVRGVGLGA